LLSTGLVLLVSKPKTGTAILLRPPPTPVPILVNIDGGVQVPGVYSLPVHSQVKDAVEAAGGLSTHANPGSINLVALLEDGSYIYIPIQNSVGDSTTGESDQIYGQSESGETISSININQASLDALISLPGIGPVTVEKIIAYREEQAFTRVEEIQKVPGIGPATYEQIKAYLTVGE